MSGNVITVQEEGITVISPSLEGVDIVADLVFIHGLGGHPERTWTYSKKSRSKSKLVSVFWPKDLLKNDFPNVRVLTYGYDSHVSKFFSPTNQSGIFAHGKKFLLAMKRKRKEAPKRPLIILAHSLGGIISKDALRQAHESENPTEKAILSSTHAVIFFGTPHRGSDYASIGQVVEGAASFLFDTNSKLLDNLVPDGDVLERVRLDFVRLLREYKFKVYSFQEGKGLAGFKFPGLRFLTKKVVPNFSSSIDHEQEERAEISANHRMMCRFHGETDEGYVLVKEVISEYLEEIIQPVKKEREKLFVECLQSLYTPVMNQRRNDIPQAESHTFEWIFTEKVFRENGTGFNEWLSGDGSMLWIKGQPAAGKSTFLKYIFEHATTVNVLKARWKSNTAVAGFFFYDQASNIQWRSFNGLLRSLLYQLLREVPKLFECVVSVYEEGCSMGKISWNGKELEKAFVAIGKQENVTGCICLFIDALDEYPGNYKEIVRNMEQLLGWFAQGAYKLKICASSRILNEFETMLPLKFPGLGQIAIHEWTLGDIEIIVSKSLKDANREVPSVCKEIVSRAKGSFGWVNLVLKTLETPLYHCESEDQLLDRLYLLPNDLNPFYAHLLDRVPKEIHYRIRTVLQLMFCNANRSQSLKFAEYGIAVALRENCIVQDEQLPLSPSDDLRRCQELKVSLDTCLGAFVELYQTEDCENSPPEWTFQPLTPAQHDFTKSELRFSHKTAKDFILTRIKCDFFQPDLPADNVLTGHIRLCRLYTQLARAKHGMYYLLGPSSLAKDAMTFDHFDTDLAVNWCLHAREAEYLQHSAIVGEVPDCHDIRDADTLVGSNKYMQWPQPLYRRAIKDLSTRHDFDPIRERRVADFQNALRFSMGTDYVQKWAERFHEVNFGNELPVPQTFFAFALLNGLYLYARDVLDSDDSYHLKRQNPPPLFWAIASCMFINQTTVMDLWWDEAERCHMFANYLLKNGANPNAVFTIPFQQEPPDESIIFEQRLRCGQAEITCLHFAIGVFISITDEGTSELRMAILELICILVENGATTGDSLYTNYWKQRLEPRERTVLHYLTFPRAYKKTTISGYVDEFDPFKVPHEGPLLRRTIKTLLDHGADPNALDSGGIDVFTQIVLACPRNLAEYALEKGALISPKLLCDDGSPVKNHEILQEERWQREVCYTPEAREIVRKHMPHWEQRPVEMPAFEASRKDHDIYDVDEGILRRN